MHARTHLKFEVPACLYLVGLKYSLKSQQGFYVQYLGVKKMSNLTNKNIQKTRFGFIVIFYWKMDIELKPWTLLLWCGELKIQMFISITLISSKQLLSIQDLDEHFYTDLVSCLDAKIITHENRIKDKWPM